MPLFVGMCQPVCEPKRPLPSCAAASLLLSSRLFGSCCCRALWASNSNLLSKFCSPSCVEDREELFCSREEFFNFFEIGGTKQASQYAKPLWDAGHKSFKSDASVKLET